MKINGVELPACTDEIGQEEAIIIDRVAYPDHTKHDLMIRLTGNCPWCGWDHPDLDYTIEVPDWAVHQ